ncbi:hypothetical protein HHK36_005417 [Tetracentron sinense]|uniref:H/ACA ribonucleoprotein complex non-core subunit NAF1 n=1 Tax=Tetracentron sinense TaxID=13715 RepID=A0A834ZVD7_TETSI|nr:hypothetical protein HHK36_005417 [Tetracentron sinense]
MVGFDPFIEDPLIPEFDYSFASLIDPFLDFDCVRDWIAETSPIKMSIEETQYPNVSESKKSELGFFEDHVEFPAEETDAENPSVDGSDTIMVEKEVSEKFGNMGSSIDESIKKVSLVEASESSYLGGHDKVSANLGGRDDLLGFDVSEGIKKEVESEVSGDATSKASLVTNLGESEGIIDEIGAEGAERPEIVNDDGGKIVEGIRKEVESEVNGDATSKALLVTNHGETEGIIDEIGVKGSDMRMVESEVSEKLGNVDYSIEEEIKKVSLIVASESSYLGDHDKVSANLGGCDDLVGLDVSSKKKSDGSLKVAEGIKEEVESEVSGDLTTKISLVTNLGEIEGIIDEIGAEGVKSCEIVNDKDESDSSESDSASSSSSSSLSSEEEEEEDREMGEVGEIEEGEIRDLDGEEIVGWSDDDDGRAVAKGPIKSKNEVEILPPVPPVDVALQPHHQTLPVGFILSIMGAKVIVEGVEKHNPLNEGSILWITKTRLPLGLVDEIFGPVKNPYYVVRYNSEKEVPDEISQGTPISFIVEFANHVLNDKNLYKKGYDASGDNDEEVSNETEFSDDEKEAEYKRMQKIAKRGPDDPKRGNREFIDRKNVRHRGGPSKNIRPPVSPAPVAVGRSPQFINQLHTPSVATPFGCGNNSSYSFGTGQGNAGGASLVPPFSQLGITPQQFLVQSNGVCTNGMPCQHQQQQAAVFPNGFSMSGMPYQQQNHHQHPHHMLTSFQNGMPFQQQFNPCQGLLPDALLPCVQPNFFAGPTSMPWQGLVDQGHFKQAPFGIGLQGPHMHLSLNVGRGVLSNGLREERSGEMLPPTASIGNVEVPQQFNQGDSSTHGSKPYRRGGGYFARGRGRRQYR